MTEPNTNPVVIDSEIIVWLLLTVQLVPDPDMILVLSNMPVPVIISPPPIFPVPPIALLIVNVLVLVLLMELIVAVNVAPIFCDCIAVRIALKDTPAPATVG